MGSSISQWGAVKVPSTEYYVDGSTPYPSNNLQNGSVGLPFSNIQQAIDDGYAKGLTDITIRVAIGVYPDPIILHQDVKYVIEGAVSGFAILGDITWPMSGIATPISQSVLLLRQCAPNNINIIDGYPISIRSTFIMENSFIFGSIIQTGTGIFNCLISGISTAASSISGPVVSSAILGDLYVPYANTGITNTQLNGSVTTNKLWSTSSQFIGGIYFITILGTEIDLQMCIFIFSPHFVFSGSPGTLFVDDATNYALATTYVTLVNGKLTLLSVNLSVGSAIYVDNSTPYPVICQTGSITLPYDSVQDAIDYAVYLGRTGNEKRFAIHVTVGDYSSENINIPEDYVWIIKGDQAGATRLGDIIWVASGGQAPPQPPSSTLVLDNLTCHSLTINDGYIPATQSIVSFQNSQVLTDIVHTGIGNIDLLLSGLTSANSGTVQGRVSSKVIGNIYMPNSVAAITSTLLDGYVYVKQLSSYSSSHRGNITTTGDVEFHDTLFAPITIALNGLASTVFLDGVSNYRALNAPINLINGMVKVIDAPIFSASQFTISLSGSNIVLLPLQYNVEYIILLGILTADINITFPLGTWIITAQDVNFNGHTITFINGTNTVSVNTSNLYNLSATVNSIVISGSSGSSGITASQHQTLRQLIHFIDEGPADGFVSGAYKNITPAGSVFPTSIIWYVDGTLTQKIVEKTIVWSGVVPNIITWKVYNPDGVTVAHMVSDSISYVNNVFEYNRIRTIS